MFKLRLFWLVLFVNAFFAFNQVYNFQYLTNQNGLPQSQAYTICFDQQQMAWIGTQGGGIAIYDGDDIQYLTKQDSLISNRVYVIKLIKDMIYIGCKGGVSVANRLGVKQNFKLEDPTVLVQDLLSYKDEIWVATNKGLYTLEGSDLKSDPKFIDENILSFFIDADDHLWLCTSKGIIQQQNPINRINKARGLRTDYITKTISYKSGWLMATYGGGLRYYNRKDKVVLLDEFETLKSTIILDLLKTENELWIATMNDGVYVYSFESNALDNFKVDNGLSNNNVRCIEKDYWGNKWIGTSGGGVSVFNNSPFLEYNKSNGLNSNYIFSVLKDSRQNLWIATQGKGVMRLNNTSTILFDEEYGFKTVKTKAIFEDSKHNIWLGTEGSGLGVVPADIEDTVYHITASNGLTSNWVKTFAEDLNNSIIYIGSSNGIYYTDGSIGTSSEVVIKKISIKGIPERINQLKWSDKHKTLYFASDKGIGAIKNGKLTFFEEGNEFRNIVDLDSVLWFGSVDRGVLRIDYKNQVVNQKSWLTQDKGLSSNNIYQLTDDYPFIWVGSEKGLTKLNTETLNMSSFGYEEGFEGVETNVNASFKDQFGDLWFGTTDGLFRYNKGNSLNSSQSLPPVFYLDDIQIFYQSIKEKPYYESYINRNKIVLPYTDNHIGFKMKAIHYTYKNRIRYRWKLNKVDQDWIPAMENNMATYSNLSPGEYTFSVIASIDNSWNAKPVTFQFKIEAPYWKTNWFKAAYISFAFILLGGIIFMLYRRGKRKNAQLLEKVEIEKSILELEQKALRLQMNPHFIFNVLNSIHNLIILNDSGKARYALAKFSKLMRQVLENSRAKLLSIDDELETISNYIQLEKLTSRGLTYMVTTP